MLNENSLTKIAVFKGKEVRKTIHNNEWWFSIIDTIEVLMDIDRPRKYWSDLKNKIIKEGYIEVSEKNRTVEINRFSLGGLVSY